MGWLLLRTLILTPILLAMALLVLLAIGIHAVYRKLFRSRTCSAHS